MSFSISDPSTRTSFSVSERSIDSVGERSDCKLRTIYTVSTVMNLCAIPLLVVALSLSPAAQMQKKATSPHAKPAESDTTVYRNATFGFRYHIPFGWVDRTKEMQGGNDASKGEV